MTTERSRDRLKPEDRKAQLVRAVYQVMSRDGVHRVPLQQIASRAGVSKGLLLYHFATKDNLVLAAMDWVLGATARRIRRRVAEASPGELLSATLDAVWVGAEANRDFFHFYLDGVEHFARSEQFARFGEQNRNVVEGLYAEIIEESVAAGEFAVLDVGTSATQMRGVIDGMFLQWLQTANWRETHGHFRRLCQLTLETLFHTPPSLTTD